MPRPHSANRMTSQSVLARERHETGGGIMNRSRQPVMYVLSWVFTGAPGRIRTRDPLLRSYRRSVAGDRLTSLYEPFASSYCRWLSEGVA